MLGTQISPLNTHIQTHTYTHTHTHTHTHKRKQKKQQQQKKKKHTPATILTTGYTLSDVNSEDTIKHNIALMTSRSRVYVIYPLNVSFF